MKPVACENGAGETGDVFVCRAALEGENKVLSMFPSLIAADSPENDCIVNGS